ncbi:hypothetical protein EJB05_33176, partial [Eragrostis curvula]
MWWPEFLSNLTDNSTVPCIVHAISLRSLLYGLAVAAAGGTIAVDVAQGLVLTLILAKAVDNHVEAREQDGHRHAPDEHGQRLRDREPGDAVREREAEDVAKASTATLAARRRQSQEDGWTSIPISSDDLLNEWLPKKVDVSLAWTLWTTRNKMTIQRKFPDNPIDVMYIAVSYLQKWKLLLKPKERSEVEHIATRVLLSMKNFKASDVPVSDIAFI